jgi:hypothetical protein
VVGLAGDVALEAAEDLASVQPFGRAFGKQLGSLLIQTTPPHPVRLVLTDDLRRSRLVTLFRLPLSFPHLAWFTLWTVPAVVAAILNWLATLTFGKSPSRLPEFLASYVRYWTHVTAFVTLAANPFPGFVGAEGSYPVDADINMRTSQTRPKTLRLAVLYPVFMLVAFVLLFLLGAIQVLVAVCAWVTSLLLGRVPEGLRNLSAYLIRYELQELSYLLGLTSRYPYSGPFYETPRYV